MSEPKRKPGETKHDANRREQEEWHAANAERERAEESANRKLYTFWQFWKFCPLKRCHRAQSCAGDTQRCHDRFWPHVPEEMKVELRASITARVQGLSVREATTQARHERARYLEREAAAVAKD